jgi:hypothetical protein
MVVGRGAMVTTKSLKLVQFKIVAYMVYCVLLQDGAGWNMRNNAYHGTIFDNQLSMDRALVVIFFLLKIYSESMIWKNAIAGPTGQESQVFNSENPL